jgi:hydrogenase expression/formation protein HypC
MCIVTVDRFVARCEARGVSRDVCLFLLPEGSVVAGDYVLVHVGYALQVLSAPEAEESWALFDVISADQDRLHA